mmetsp:Transcript_22113/g.41211  ORF Transcript_22113/g.41211 Transcript_22113/m.41211 type:complete len:91 (-) Transcript_22113:2651-2923(-)
MFTWLDTKAGHSKLPVSEQGFSSVLLVPSTLPSKLGRRSHKLAYQTILTAKLLFSCCHLGCYVSCSYIMAQQIQCTCPNTQSLLGAISLS